MAGAALLVGCGPERFASTPTATTAATASTATALPTAVSAATSPTTVTLAATEGVTAVPTCVVRPELTEGPYFVDGQVERADIRSDPATGVVSEGALLALAFNVSQISNGACTPLPGAVVGVWHCDALGVYSGVSDPGFDTSDQAFLRGYLLTDENGVAKFTTIYPGWYPGRTTHIHFKIRTDPASDSGYEFTSQLFFDEALTDEVHAKEPYASKGYRNTLNSNDNIYNDQLLLAAGPANEGYAATFDIALDLN